MDKYTSIISGFGRHVIHMLPMWMMLIPLIVDAETHTETFVIDFSENDFVWSVNNDGEIEIDSMKDFAYPESDKPGLPVISKEIAIDGSYSYKSVSVSFEKRELLSGVRVAPAPLLTTTEELHESHTAVKRSYDVTQKFPESNCLYVSTSNWGNIRVLHFLTSPFIYEASTKKLYFIDSITLNVELLDDQSPAAYRAANSSETAVLKGMVVNPEIIDVLVASHPATQQLEIEDRVDYVVITNQELAQSFKPLCQWKTEKGLYAKVITIEDIKNNYKGEDIQLKIKNCLYDLYKNHGLKYALLGGDDYAVPVRGCYGSVTVDRGTIKDTTIPTDMYYACFDECFDWDDNGNGIYGELTDNINLKQSIYITRLPVCRPVQVESFIDKLLAYEKNPKFNNNFLMCGVSLLDTITPSHSDAELQGNRQYSRYIKPYWDGIRYKFYDTCTDFEGNEAYEFSAENLSEQLERGYTFMNFHTHGTQTSWSTESGKHYDITFGNKQQNTAQTIITTTACHTNAFDLSTKSGTIDPCLSESLIRNLNSGVIAFLGSSRQGFGYSGNNLGVSITYEGAFYEKLFSKTIKSMSFGEIVEAAKSGRISSCGKIGSWRFVQFGLNPIGDPEMPIWISEPKNFDNVNISIEGSFVNFYAGEDQSRICIVDEWDHGEGYFNVFEDTNNALVSDLPEESSICFTKPGYIPKQYKLNIFQNKTFSGNRKLSNDVILCGSSITSSMKQGQFVIKEGKTTLTGDIVVLGPGTKIESGAQLVVNNN